MPASRPLCALLAFCCEFAPEEQCGLSNSVDYRTAWPSTLPTSAKLNATGLPRSFSHTHNGIFWDLIVRCKSVQTNSISGVQPSYSKYDNLSKASACKS